MPRVLVNGCFDLFHDGHLKFLRTAQRFGDVLVGLNDDSSVARLKGPDRPVQNLIERHRGLEMRGFEVFVFDGYSDDLVRRIGPEIIVRGHDQTVSAEDRKHIVVIVPKMGDISTTGILQ